jgi:lipopolysaccharide export system permease protein
MIFKYIDRQLVRGYFKSFFICLLSMLSLYVVVDLFMNLDEFTHHHQSLREVAEHIASYYCYKIVGIYDRLSEAIVLLAAMFTVAWMQRNNEQVPLLSAGVSTRRIVLPVLLCACFMLSLTILNQEFLLPRIADKLGLERDDPGGVKELPVRHAFESNLIHVTGLKARRSGRVILDFQCYIPESVAGSPIHLTAREAHYLRGPGPRQGAWELTGTEPADLEGVPGVLDFKDFGRYVLHVKDADFDALTRNPNWFLLASTYAIYQELQRPESQRVASMAVLFHTRLTRPILGMLLVFLGLSVILRDQNRNVIISSGLCLVLCGVFFAACYACKMLGDNEYLSPALAAWVPILFFGPHALVLFDAVHT